MIEVELIGCLGYTLHGTRYVADKNYLVDQNTADLLLGRVNKYGLPYFQVAEPAEATPEEDSLEVASNPKPKSKGKGKAKPRSTVTPSTKVNVPDDAENEPTVDI